MTENKTQLQKFMDILGDKAKELKELFAEPTPVVTPAAEPTPVIEFADVKTADGNILRIEGKTPSVGAKCSMVDASGENPAPDGEYVLEDGTNLTVVGGAITEVEPANAEATEPEMQKAPAKMDEEMHKEITNQVKSITYKYAEIEKALNESKETFSKQLSEVVAENKKLSEQNKAMFAVIAQLAELPTDEPAQRPKNTGLSPLAEFRASVKEMKENRNKRD